MFLNFIKILGERLGIRYCFNQLKEVIKTLFYLLLTLIPVHLIGLVMFRFVFNINAISTSTLGAHWYNPMYTFFGFVFLSCIWCLIGLVIVLIKLYRLIKDCWTQAKRS